MAAHLRWYGYYRLRSSGFHPSNPIIGLAVIDVTILEVPIVACIGVPTKRIVGSDCISTPTGQGDAELLNVGRIRGEIDAINEGGDRVTD